MVQYLCGVYDIFSSQLNYTLDIAGWTLKPVLACSEMCSSLGLPSVMCIWDYNVNYVRLANVALGGCRT